MPNEGSKRLVENDIINNNQESTFLRRSIDKERVLDYQKYLVELQKERLKLESNIKKSYGPIG